MNRTIKFRVWYKKISKWVTNLDGLPISIGLNNIGAVFTDYDEGIDKAELYSLGEDFIVQQFTGLKDKDGREIYEGDIVKIESLKIKEYATFSEVKIPNCYNEYSSAQIKIKIIGNIFENPELLSKTA